MQEESDGYAVLALALEAALCCLYTLTAPNMPKTVYNEDIIEGILNFTKVHLTQNLLVFHDARLCQLHRPMLQQGGGSSDLATGLIVNAAILKNAPTVDQGRTTLSMRAPRRRGTAPARPRPNRSIRAPAGARRMYQGLGKDEHHQGMTQPFHNCCRVPRAVDMLQGKVELLMKHLARLLGTVRLQANMLIPFVRTAAKALTVEGLDVLQVQVIGAPFAPNGHTILVT